MYESFYLFHFHIIREFFIYRYWNCTGIPLLSGFIKEKFPTKIGLMIGIYSVGMGTGASLSAGLTIPLQHVLKGSWNMALAFGVH